MSNRRFGTTDLAIVMGLWSAMAVLLGGVLSELTSDVETPLAKAQSEAYAMQLAEGLKAEPAMDPTKGGRAPASAMGDPSFRMGSLGKDPWGHAYQYQIVPAGVVVWSVGKNKITDSTEAIASLEAGQPLRDFHFVGDDVGYVKSHPKTR